MIEKIFQEVRWLEYPILQRFPVKHGVFLKDGGVSTGPFATLNTSDLQGDLIDSVKENQKRIASSLNLSTVVYAEQTHSDQVVEVLSGSQRIVGDAMVTNKKGISLAIRHADCQAAIFYDPVHHAIGMAHAGWRGNVLEIYRKTVEKMKALYESDPKELFVAISPSLGPNKAEFIHYKEEFPQSFWKYQTRPNYFDLWKVAEEELLQTGIHPSRIEIAKICTYENERDFFSYRREKKSGRHATLAALL